MPSFPIHWMCVDVVFLKGEGLGTAVLDAGVPLAACRTRSAGSFLESSPGRAARAGGWQPRGDLELSRTQWLPEGAGSWGMAKVWVSEAMEETASLWMCWRNSFQPGEGLSGWAKAKPNDRTSVPNHDRRFLCKPSHLVSITYGRQISLLNIFLF